MSEKVTLTSDDVGTLVVTAVGTARRDRSRGDAIQTAMGEAVHAASRECEAIWAREDISLEEKNAMIAAINHPDEIRRRMLAAREAVKAAFRPAPEA